MTNDMRSAPRAAQGLPGRERGKWPAAAALAPSARPAHDRLDRPAASLLLALIALTVGEIDFAALVTSISTPTRRCCWPPSPSTTSASRYAAIAGCCCCAAPARSVSVRDSTEIIFISWLVNCLVPAKLGDVYRAYLLRLNFDVSLSRTFRHGLHRARLRPLRHRPARAWPPASGASATGLSPEVQLVFGDRRRFRRGAGTRAVHGAQLRQPDHPSPATAKPHGRVLRSLRGGPLLDRGASPAGADRRHRADLGDRGDAAVPRHPGPRLRISIWASAAHSSSP